MAMVWMCLFLTWGNADVPWDDLVTARLTKQSGTLNPDFWLDPAKPAKVREAYVLTLGQIGNPAAGPLLLKTFADSDIQASAILAYGELELVETAPLFDWLPKVSPIHQHLVMEALSKHVQAQEHDKLVQAWSSLSEKTQDQSLFYLWRNKPEGVTKAVIKRLEASTTPSLAGHVYYLFRSRTKVPAALVTKLFDLYSEDPQALIYASRLLVEGDTGGLVKRFKALASHKDWRLRNQALQGITRLDGADVDLAETLLADANPNVRKTAVRTLVNARSAEADAKLLAFAETAAPTLIQTMVTNASEEQLPKFLPLAKGWAASKTSWKRWHGLRFQGLAEDLVDQALLEKQILTLESTPTVLSLNALNQIAPEKARALAPQLVKRQDPFVLNAVLNTLSSEPLGRWTVPFEEMRALVHGEYRENIFQHTFIQGLSVWLPKEMARAEKQKLMEHPDYMVRYNTVRGLAQPDASQWQQVFSKAWDTPFPKKARDLAAKLFHADKIWHLKLMTAKGDVLIKLEPHLAPITTANLAYLSNSSYFVGLPLHRVVPNFVVQMGDGRGDGSGGPGYSIPCEVNPLRYRRGAVGMALLSKDSGGSQFFICHSDQPHLDGGYTIFGSVTEAGMAVVDQMEEGDVIIRAVLELEAGAAAGLK